MKLPFLHSRRMRYGSMTVSLTITLVAVLVLFNLIFSALANYYGWYVDMTRNKVYSISDLCHSMIDDMFDQIEGKIGKEPKIEILFCEDPEKYAVGEAGYYIYETVKELDEKYDQIDTDWFDCLIYPTRAKELGVTSPKNVVLKLSDETIKALGATDKDAITSRVFVQQDFFVFQTGDTSSPTGYDGERIFATTLSALLFSDRPLAVLTSNHEELPFDNKLFLLLSKAGFNFMALDLYYKDIPENCELLITFNPNKDFVTTDGVSSTDEIKKVEEYLAKGGDMMVFLSASSPELPALEGLLADWGVSIGRTYDARTDHSYSAVVKDDSASLTADGFTIFGEYVTKGEGAKVTDRLRKDDHVPHVVFRDAAVLLPSEGFTASGDYTYTAGTRTRSDVFVGSSSAKAWANGSALKGYDDPLSLMTMTKDSSTGAQVMVCSSTEFADESLLQSAVFGNDDVMLCVMEQMGIEHLLIGLRYKPFDTTTISSITTSQMLSWTLWLSITPAVLILAVATFVLVRRKYS